MLLEEKAREGSRTVPKMEINENLVDGGKQKKKKKRREKTKIEWLLRVMK